MRILITGVCGFVGSRLALALLDRLADVQIAGIDNLLRPGSEGNRAELTKRGLTFQHGDLRMRSDVETLPACDWVIDAAANPSVLAGVDGKSSPRQLAEHNLSGTLNILEYCREKQAGLILLSTSRVYSVKDLAGLPLRVNGNSFELDVSQTRTADVSAARTTRELPVTSPMTLFCGSPLASEIK